MRGWHICATGLVIWGGRYYVTNDAGITYSGHGRAALELPAGTYFVQTPDPDKIYDAIPIFITLDSPRDVNCDGKTDSRDWISLMNWINAEDLQGDYNADGAVNSQDFVLYMNTNTGSKS